MKLLINKGAQLDRHDNNGDTALILAVISNNLGALEKLLEMGANPTLRNKQGETVLSIAQALNNIEMIELLEKAIKDKAYFFFNRAMVSSIAQSSGLVHFST